MDSGCHEAHIFRMKSFGEGGSLSSFVAWVVETIVSDGVFDQFVALESVRFGGSRVVL